MRMRSIWEKIEAGEKKIAREMTRAVQHAAGFIFLDEVKIQWFWAMPKDQGKISELEYLRLLITFKVYLVGAHGQTFLD